MTMFVDRERLDAVLAMKRARYPEFAPAIDAYQAALSAHDDTRAVVRACEAALDGLPGYERPMKSRSA